MSVIRANKSHACDKCNGEIVSGDCYTRQNTSRSLHGRPVGIVLRYCNVCVPIESEPACKPRIYKTKNRPKGDWGSFVYDLRASRRWSRRTGVSKDAALLAAGYFPPDAPRTSSILDSRLKSLSPSLRIAMLRLAESSPKHQKTVASLIDAYLNSVSSAESAQKAG